MIELAESNLCADMPLQVINPQVAVANFCDADRNFLRVRREIHLPLKNGCSYTCQLRSGPVEPSQLGSTDLLSQLVSHHALRGVEHYLPNRSVIKNLFACRP